jgi:hypothetical protein
MLTPNVETLQSIIAALRSKSASAPAIVAKLSSSLKLSDTDLSDVEEEKGPTDEQTL